MRLSKPALYVLKHPADFVLRILRGFRNNQGLLLAGAVAYYALLSVLPLLTLSVIALSQFVDQAVLINTVRRYLEWLVPSQSKAVLIDVSGFLEKRVSYGVVLKKNAISWCQSLSRTFSFYFFALPCWA